MFKWFMMSSGEVEKREGSQVAISGAQPLRELWPYVLGTYESPSGLGFPLNCKDREPP